MYVCSYKVSILRITESLFQTSFSGYMNGSETVNENSLLHA